MSAPDDRDRTRFVPGLKLTAAVLDDAFERRAEASTRHDDDVHGGEGGTRLTAASLAAAFGRVVARVVRGGGTSAVDIGVRKGAGLRLDFDAAARPRTTVAGRTRLDKASAPALRLTGKAAKGGPAAGSSDPRAARFAPDSKSVRLLLPEPTPGGRVGRFTVAIAGDAAPKFEVRPGAIRVAGDLQAQGKITRKGEQEATAEVGEAAAIAAWLQTPQGRAARKDILDEVAEKLKLRLRDVRVESADGGERVVFGFELVNETSMPLRNHLAFGALARTRDETPVWQRLADQPRPVLEAGATYTPKKPVSLPRKPADAAFLTVFVSGLVTYDIGVTVGPIVRDLRQGGPQ